MNYSEMVDAVRDAENTLRLADTAADDMARMLVGRLRKVTSYQGVNALCSLKRELGSFNMTTRAWKS